MHPLGSVDHYALLGVSPDASSDTIRAAFLASVKRAHPDRIDRASSPLEWDFANQVMAALTRAYSVLRDPAQRTMYDAALATSGKRHAASSRGPEPQRVDPRSAELRRAQAAVSRGAAFFRSLAPDLQAELRRRQVEDGPDSVRKTTETATAYYCGIAVCAGWWLYMFGEGSGGQTWTWQSAASYYGASAVSGWVGAVSIAALHRWHRSPLRPAFYLTRLHFVTTTLTSVSYWPLWEFRDASVVHHYTNHTYQKSTLTFFLGDSPQSLEFSSKPAVERFWDQLRKFQEEAIGAERAMDADYFRRHNLFAGAVSDRIVESPSGISGSVRKWSIAGGLVLCFLASLRNDHMRDTRWFKHEPPLVTSARPRGTSSDLVPKAAKPSSVADFSSRHPPQPIPRNGELRCPPSLERIAPMTLNASGDESFLVKLVSASKLEVTVFVRAGATAQVDVPLGTYELRYASGTTWYGYEYLFGPETSYAKADQVFGFTRFGDSVSGYTVTLYKVRDGNLRTTSISPEKF